MKIPTLLAVSGIGLLSVMDSLIKQISDRFHTFEIAFLRYALGIVFAAAVVAFVRPGWPTRAALFINGSRSFIVAITATCFFYALSALPQAEAVALSFLSPIFLALFGILLLGEKANPRIWVALALGLVGMAVIVGPRLSGNYSEQAMLGALAAFVSAITFALAMVLLRARARHDAISMIVFIQNVGPALILALPAGLVWEPLTGAEWGQFALIGALGTAGHLLLARAFALAEASALAPIEYTSLVWAIGLGYLFFHDLPTVWVLAGAVLIVIGTWVTGKHEPTPDIDVEVDPESNGAPQPPSASPPSGSLPTQVRLTNSDPNR